MKGKKGEKIGHCQTSNSQDEPSVTRQMSVSAQGCGPLLCWSWLVVGRTVTWRAFSYGAKDALRHPHFHAFRDEADLD